MANSSINEFTPSVNEEVHLRSYDRVNEYLSKAMALSQLTIHDDFLNYSDRIIHDYLWALTEMVEKAYENCQSMLSCFGVTACNLGSKPVSTEMEG